MGKTKEIFKSFGLEIEEKSSVLFNQGGYREHSQSVLNIKEDRTSQEEIIDTVFKIVMDENKAISIKNVEIFVKEMDLEGKVQKEFYPALKELQLNYRSIPNKFVWGNDPDDIIEFRWNLEEKDYQKIVELVMPEMKIKHLFGVNDVENELEALLIMEFKNILEKLKLLDFSELKKQVVQSELDKMQKKANSLLRQLMGS